MRIAVMFSFVCESRLVRYSIIGVWVALRGRFGWLHMHSILVLENFSCSSNCSGYGSELCKQEMVVDFCNSAWMAMSRKCAFIDRRKLLLKAIQRVLL
jgi:hypothetical protein